MDIKSLLKYDNVTIQCHDNPDADSIASGWGLYTYFKMNGRNPSLIYSGKLEITKGNLKMMVGELDIPIEYRKDNTTPVAGLLITVDCQYGARNVTKFQADDVVIIDHHQQEVDGIEKIYIASNLGGCSTFVWKLLKDAGFDFNEVPTLQTALYYGLMTDTGGFTGISNPLDRDMSDELAADQALINRLQNSNISMKELEIAGVAMIRSIINADLHYAVVKAEPCDPNILGLISDMVLQVSEIDYCVVFTVFDYGIKFSVRSCIKEAKANHIADYVSRNIGSGGGHLYKAGGFIGIREYNAQYENFDPVTYFSNKLRDFRTDYDILDTSADTFDAAGCGVYKKKPAKVGYVVAKEILPVGETITVRTLEGDLHIEVTDDTYIMIGIKGEIYPIKESKFLMGYRKVDEPYDLVLEYHPKAKITTSGKSYDLMEYARSCYTTGETSVYARKLTKGVKIFTQWDRECYMLGEAGDYIAARKEDLSDMYVIENTIFGMTYEETIDE